MHKVLLNLLNFPPSEGSRAAHEAWKQNVRMIGFSNGSPSQGSEELWLEITKPGYVTKTCRDAAKAYVEVLTKSQV